MSFVDPAALRAFIAVAEAGSFTAAARTLGSTKLRVSREVSRLERDLGTTLLLRTTRALRLTEAGERVLAQGPDVLRRMADLTRSVSDVSEHPRGRLSIVAHPLIYELLLEPVVLPFIELHPGVTLELDVSMAPDQLGTFDLALVVGAPKSSNLGMVSIGRTSLGCYASRTYRERAGFPEHPEDLARHDVLIAAKPGLPSSWTFTKHGRATTVSVKPRMTVASHDLLLRAVEKGVGIARLPTFLAARSRSLEAVMPSFGMPDIRAVALFPSRERPTPAVRAFLDLMKSRLAALAPRRALRD